MRHKYDTPCLVLARTPLGEESALLTLLTPTLGLVRARAQSVRHSGAKLAAALTTLSESRVILVKGQEGWRLAGAVLETPWSTQFVEASARELVGRVNGLLIRLVGSEEYNPELFPIMKELLTALTMVSVDQYDAVETRAALKVMAALGLDAGEIPVSLDAVNEGRTEYISRINRGITASGL